MPEKKSQSGRNYSKYDDWICLFCQNHNYSFRTVCTSHLIQATAATSKPRSTTPTCFSSSRDSSNRPLCPSLPQLNPPHQKTPSPTSCC